MKTTLEKFWKKKTDLHWNTYWWKDECSVADFTINLLTSDVTASHGFEIIVLWNEALVTSSMVVSMPYVQLAFFSALGAVSFHCYEIVSLEEVQPFLIRFFSEICKHFQIPSIYIYICVWSFLFNLCSIKQNFSSWAKYDNFG